MPFIKQRGPKAQSLVEFALVLPIFLLLVVGIFTFGHLFFTYTQVVAASREAARVGAAVGLTDSFVPSFRDCDNIRASAARIGLFAGVQATEDIVQIGYDQGPKKDGSDADPHPDGCPTGGIGPGYIELGDRIVVTVSVMYRSITPLIDLGEFPITATTRRTIVLGMPVGDVPVAKSLCTGTLTRILPPTFNTELVGSYSRVGEAVSFGIEVIADTPNTVAPGSVKLYVDKPYNGTPDCIGGSPLAECKDKTFAWHEVGTHLIRAEFAPNTTSGPGCYQSSRAEVVRHYVLPSSTTTEVYTNEEKESYLDQPISVTAIVRPVAPGAGVPEGVFKISDENGQSCTTGRTMPYKTEDAGWASCTLMMTKFGQDKITAEFQPILNGDITYYDPSSAWMFHNVIYEFEPTLIPSPTLTPTTTATPTITPTPTPEITPTINPSLCPVIVEGNQGQIDFGASDSSMVITLDNQAPIDVRLVSVQVNWPPDSTANLIGINTGPAPLAACAGDRCMWSSAPQPPPSFTASPGMEGWSLVGSTLPRNAITQLRVDFDAALPTTLLKDPYRIVLQFQSDPLLQCPDVTATGNKAALPAEE